MYQCFNSKLVRLKDALTFEGKTLTQLCFNSKLVRLKAKHNRQLVTLPTFQFQTGSIKRVSALWQQIVHSRFNSKLVRLKVGYYLGVDNERMKSFNSKLVRLKASFSKSTIIGGNKFQFQTGSIKSSAYEILFSICNLVSIPNWFD